METMKRKTLVMIGIHRKGEKGFKVRVKNDAVISPSNMTNLHLPLTKWYDKSAPARGKTDC